MTAASTHDTKRGEDVRARIAVLAEVPDVWERALDRLLELAPLPDAGFGNLLWQAVVGVWSDDPALRRGSTRTPRRRCARPATGPRGPRPTRRYEWAVHAAVDAAFDDERVRAVLDEVLLEVGDAGRSNALSAKLLGLTMPGVPDVYQGSELREDSLVDPDNRRPVDFDERTSAGRRGPSRPPQAAAGARGAAAAPRPARALHVVRRGAGHRRGRRPRARLRPRRRGHRRHPAAPRPGPPRRLGRHHARAARGSVARPADRRGRRQRRLRRRGRPAGRAPVALLEALPEQPRRRGQFEVWAPRPERVRLVGRRRGRRDGPRTRRLVATGGAGAATGDVDYGYLVDDAETPSPTRARGASRTASTAARAPSTPTRTPGPTTRWRGRRSRARRSTSCTSAPSPPRAPSTPRSSGSTTCVDRRRLRRADAGQRLQRRARLGLRRRAVVGGPRALRRPGGLPALRRRLPRPRPRRDPGRGPQPPRPLGQLPPGSSVPTSSTATPRGATRSTSTTTARTRCGG